MASGWVTWVRGAALSTIRRESRNIRARNGRRLVLKAGFIQILRSPKANGRSSATSQRASCRERRPPNDTADRPRARGVHLAVPWQVEQGNRDRTAHLRSDDRGPSQDDLQEIR